MADRAPIVIVSGSWQQIQSGDYIANSWINWASPGNIGTTLAASANFSSVTIPSALGGISAAAAGVLGLSANSNIAVEIHSGGSGGRLTLTGAGSNATVSTTGGNLELNAASGLITMLCSAYAAGVFETDSIFSIGAYYSAGWYRRSTTTPFGIVSDYSDTLSVSFVVAAGGTANSAITTWYEALKITETGAVITDRGSRFYSPATINGYTSLGGLSNMGSFSPGVYAAVSPTLTACKRTNGGTQTLRNLQVDVDTGLSYNGVIIADDAGLVLPSNASAAGKVFAARYLGGFN